MAISPRCQFCWIVAFEHDLGTRLRRQLGPVDHAAAAEMGGIAVGVGHVVAVGQKDVGDSAPRFKLSNELRQKLRRVDEPVSFWVLDEVAIAAERLGRVEAAVVDRLFDKDRKIGHHRFAIVVAVIADRAGRAGEQGPQRVAAGGRDVRLAVDVGRVASFREDLRRNLAAGVAIDARRIDEEVAGHVVANAFAGIGHVAIVRACRLTRKCGDALNPVRDGADWPNDPTDHCR